MKALEPNERGSIITVCIIPARGGSKRIPRKNIKLFCGLPMIAYSIRAALESDVFKRVIVTTDDQEIAEIAVNYGAETPFLRPAELADDYQSVGKPMMHALEWLKESGFEFDFHCMLFATAPFVRPERLRESFEIFRARPDKAECFSVVEYTFPIQRAIRITEDGAADMFQPEYFSCRSQDLEQAYHDAGQFSWAAYSRPNLDQTAWGPSTLPYVIPHYEAVDIDTPDDWVRAELMYKALQDAQGGQA
ncbi:pseudaminic acid cytidylyltransferase [Magnetovibrio sp. PR-2]|uniref:pseudaminic acid cytidylyltransferase n=1 Tax=Magnetovibrio sp. PR-2 TaxID=3120356 RepID=UPI002FCDE7E6